MFAFVVVLPEDNVDDVPHVNEMLASALPSPVR